MLRQEAQALTLPADSLDGELAKALDILAHVTGRVVVTGMGKSGPYRAEDCRHPGFDRYPGPVRPSGRSQSYGDLGMVTAGRGPGVE